MEGKGEMVVLRLGKDGILGSRAMPRNILEKTSNL